MRYWENDGKPIDSSGRLCLVMDPEDGTGAIRTYGKTREEIFEKVAKTAETAQQQINRLRNAPAAATPTATAPPVAAPIARREVSADDLMLASQKFDSGNPAERGEALKVMLRSEGFDLDKIRRNDLIERVKGICQEWEKSNPDFNKDDERNCRLLVDKATLNVGFQNITAQALDAAYAQLSSMGMLYDEVPVTQEVTPVTTQTHGNELPRVERTRTATSYSRNSLRAAPPVARRQSFYTSAELSAMNSKEFEEKVLNVPEVAEWYNSRSNAA